MVSYFSSPNQRSSRSNLRTHCISQQTASSLSSQSAEGEKRKTKETRFSVIAKIQKIKFQNVVANGDAMWNDGGFVTSFIAQKTLIIIIIIIVEMIFI